MGSRSAAHSGRQRMRISSSKNPLMWGDKREIEPASLGGQRLIRRHDSQFQHADQGESPAGMITQPMSAFIGLGCIKGVRRLGSLLVLSAAVFVLVIAQTDRAVPSFAQELRDLSRPACDHRQQDRVVANPMQSMSTRLR